MKKRKALRCLRRAAAAAGMTVEQYLAWRQRELPDDHPDTGGEPTPSSEPLGRRMIRVVERSGALEKVEHKMHKRRGRKRHLNAKALLVGIQLAACLLGSYRRSDVCSILNGLHPAIAAELGLVDHHGCPITVKYKVVQATCRWLEWRLRLGWYADDVRCDLAWITNAMVAASVPRRIRRTATAVALDSTPVEAYAVTRTFTRQADLDDAAKARVKEAARLKNDPYAQHRRDILDDPDLTEPEDKKRHLAADAEKLGIKVGRDGRIIRGKDPDMRVGWATATAKRKARFFVGYDLHIVVLCRSIAWQGDPRRYQMGPKRPLYVLSMTMVPAGTNPGPLGYDAVMKAREIAPKIREVIADRAYTVKRETFLRPLHEQNINVVMDYPKTDPIKLGKREQPAIMNCGTILPTWVASDRLVLPEHLRGRYPPGTTEEQRKELTKEQRKQLRDKQRRDRQEWYAKRAKEDRWSTNGRASSNNKGSTRPMLCPVHAGRAAARDTAASYTAPFTKTGDGACCGGQVSVKLEDLDFYQDHPFGTPVWWKSYHRRSVVESVIGKLKKQGLRGGACQAFGLAANTLAAAANIVAYNKKLTAKKERKKRRQKAEKRTAAIIALLTADTPRTAPTDQPAAGDAETPTRAPP